MAWWEKITYSNQILSRKSELDAWKKMSYMLREQKLTGHPEVEDGTWWGRCMLTLQGNNNGDSQAAHPQRWDQSRHTERAENTVKR